MRVGDQVELHELRIYDNTGSLFSQQLGEIVDIRGLLFKRYTVAYYNPVLLKPKFCVVRRGQFSPLYDAAMNHDGFKYE